MPTAQDLFAAAFSIVSSAALFAYALLPADKSLLI
ncbi:MAG: enoyl-CoA hydratase [Pseudomonadota bacterium]